MHYFKFVNEDNGHRLVGLTESKSNDIILEAQEIFMALEGIEEERESLFIRDLSPNSFLKEIYIDKKIIRVMRLRDTIGLLIHMTELNYKIRPRSVYFTAVIPKLAERLRRIVKSHLLSV